MMISMFLRIIYCFALRLMFVAYVTLIHEMEH